MPLKKGDLITITSLDSDKDNKYICCPFKEALKLNKLIVDKVERLFEEERYFFIALRCFTNRRRKEQLYKNNEKIKRFFIHLLH